MANIDRFIKELDGGGARANLFQVDITTGLGNTAAALASFMCKGAQLPASVVAQIDVPYRGRQLKVAGDRTFENWTVTIFNDNAMEIRNDFEKWMDRINSHQSNTGLLDPEDYKEDLQVTQFDRSDKATKKYNIVGAFPVNCSAIDLSYDANDAVEEFTVEFAFDYWTTGANGATTGITS